MAFLRQSTEHFQVTANERVYKIALVFKVVCCKWNEGKQKKKVVPLGNGVH